MSLPKQNIVRENGVWVLRVERPNGKTQEYRSASEAQIRQLQQLFAAPITMPQTAA